MEFDISKIKLSGNKYALISDIREIMKPKQKSPGNWWRLSTIGDFELCHYGAGIVCLHFHYYANHKPISNWYTYSPALSITTLDDGGWRAEGQEMDKEDCINFIDKHAKILDDLTILPNEKDLNKLLQPLGMYGIFG